MEKKKKKTSNQAVIQRNTYTAEHRERARRYYLMGLTLPEISKLLDGAPVRTIEKWQISGKWRALKEVEPIKERVLSLHNAGRSYNEIAGILKINRVTVWRWLKQAKEASKAKQ
jgi:DNA-directed RNA polymerase specialized sigma24 family protein